MMMKSLKILILLLFLSVFNNTAFAQSPTRIICYSTVNNSTKPLYVFVFGKKKTHVLTNEKAIDSLATIFDLSAIEDVRVLQAAQATALYGTRAQNGVVLITIKKEFSRKSYKKLKPYLG